MGWMGKAQSWCQERMDRAFAAWKETPAGRNWWEKWARKPHQPALVRFCVPGVATNSPYAHGFSVPDYVRDLIEAIGKGDEHTAKSIMMWTPEDA